MYSHAKQILKLYEKAKQEIDHLKNVVTGSLKIGASYTIGEYLLPGLLAEFASQYPNVDIEVSIANTDEVAQAIRSNHLDIGLVEGQVHYSDVDVQPFMDDEMILVVPNHHPLARLSIVTAESLQDQVWILRESGSGTRAFSDQLIHDWGLRVKRSFVFGSNQGVKQATMAGLGIALLSCLVVRKELDADELTAIRIKGKRLIRLFSIVRPKEPPQARAIEIFLDKLISFQNP